MRFSPCPVGLSSYHFCSMVKLRCLRRCHFCGHHVTDPTAYRQQGDHEGKNQVAHG